VYAKVAAGKPVIGRGVETTMAAVQASLSFGTSYNVMDVEAEVIVKRNMAGTGSMSVTVVGDNLGQSHVCRGTRHVSRAIGGCSVEDTNWATTTSVLGKEAHYRDDYSPQEIEGN